MFSTPNVNLEKKSKGNLKELFAKISEDHF